MGARTRATRHHDLYTDFPEACHGPGCPVCTLVARTRWRYLDSLAYESVNDIGLRARLREALGFCNRHAWYLLEVVRAPLGTAIIYRDMLHAVQRASQALGAAALAQALAPPRPCLACAAEWTAADDLLHALAHGRDGALLRAAFTTSAGMCVPHLQQALTAGLLAAHPALAATALARWDQPTDAAGLRIRAAAAEGSFGTDDRAWSEDPAAVVTARPLPPAAPTPAADLLPFTCPVCQATRAALAGVGTWQALDDGEGGLCNVHAWQPAGADCPSLYARPIERLRVETRAAVARGTGVAQVLRRVGRRWRGVTAPVRLAPPSVPCVACRAQAAVERGRLEQPVGPLCVPHLRLALGRHGLAALESTRPAWAELDALAGEYIRKEDYRFRQEPRGREQQTPPWLVALIAGAAGLR
jgi:hypothetical protein